MEDLDHLPPPNRTRSGIDVLDELVGGGWVEGCVYELAGGPGSGKSTMALDLATRFPSDAAYLTGEETVQAVRLRAADRLGRPRPDLRVTEAHTLDVLDELPESVLFVVVDSLSVLRDPGVSGTAGSNDQLVANVLRLSRWTKARKAVSLVIRHVNKRGQSAGTMAAEHLVDCALRLRRGTGYLKVQKNRHGPAPRGAWIKHVKEGLTYELEAVDDDGEASGRGGARPRRAAARGARRDRDELGGEE